MIDFFFKKKEIVFDCFTYDASTYEYAKIAPAVKTIPDWFKSIPSKFTAPSQYVDYSEVPTLKSCYGLLEYFKQSFVLPMWSEVVIKTTDTEFFWEFTTILDRPVSHEDIQTNNVFSNIFFHLKFIPPWQIRCKDDVKVLFVEPFWNSCVDQSFFNSFKVQPGIVNFKFSSSPNVNTFIKKTNNRFKIEHGYPLVQMFPLTEEKVKFCNHLVTLEEYRKMSLVPPHTTFHRLKKAREIFKND